MIRRLLLAATAAALALPAFAGDAPRARELEMSLSFDFDVPMFLAEASEPHRGPADWQAYGEQMREWAHDFTRNLNGSMAYLFSDRVGSGKVVKGAPYSADIVTELNQPMTDGNAITHKSVNRVYRDGEGRTRQETYRGDALRSVYISDPVANASYTLVPGSKIAVSIPRVARLAPSAPPGKTAGDGSAEATQRRIVVKTIDARDGEPTREEVRVQVLNMGDDLAPMAPPPLPPVPTVPPLPPQAPGAAPRAPIPPIPPLPPIPGLQTMRFESTASLGKGATTKLGMKDFDGVKAEGTSIVWTIPAGQIGNRNPINVTKESWYSPDLQVVVYTRHNDPRTGESIYRLASIKRTEPSPDLFKVPDGYTLKGRGRHGAAPEAKAPNPPG